MSTLSNVCIFTGTKTLPGQRSLLQVLSVRPRLFWCATVIPACPMRSLKKVSATVDQSQAKIPPDMHMAGSGRWLVDAPTLCPGGVPVKTDPNLSQELRPVHQPAPRS
jgi:hypothetical protein